MPLSRLLIAASLAALPAAAQPLTVTPFHQNGIYDLGESAGWTVVGSSPNTYTFTIRKNNQDVLRTGSLDLSSGSATIEVTVNEPAMLYVELNPGGATLGAAIAPQRLEPSVPRPADFDAFWQSKLRALRQLPMNPKLTPVPTNIEGVELSMLDLNSFGSNLQAYLAKPQRAGKFPALVIYQYIAPLPPVAGQRGSL